MKTLVLSTLLAVLASACMTDDPDTVFVADQDEVATTATAASAKRDGTTEFRVVDAALPYAAVDDRAFLVFKTRRAFLEHYGLRSNFRLDVNFSNQWVFVYQAGEQSTGGYIASILDITVRNTNKIRFVTQLVTPGENCITTQALTRPYVVVAFRKPVRPASAMFSVSNGRFANDCLEPPTCALVDCRDGFICDDSSGEPVCLPDTRVSCAAVLCATNTYCDESTDTALCLPLVCPAPGTTFNCKLPLTPDRGPSCNESFRVWVGGNCRDVTFAL